MKRVIIIVFLALVFLSANVFALIGLGIGAAFNLELFRAEGTYPGAALTISLPKIPLVIGAGVLISGEEFLVGITADWWIFQEKLGSIAGLYIGPGIYLKIGTPFEFGVRVPVGFQIFPIDPLELFLELAPQLGIGFADPIRFPQVTVAGSVGFRFWF